jgi:purine-binding chemotaxis protein CheW
MARLLQITQNSLVKMVWISLSRKSVECPMQQSRKLLVFILDERKFSVDLSTVVRVVRMVEITPLPQCPDVVLGLINVQGQIIPVVSIRKRCRLRERAPRLNDRLIVLRIPERMVALIVDEVIGVVHGGDQEVVASQQLFPGIDAIDGVVKHNEDIVLIQGMEQFLLARDERELSKAMQNMGELQL